MTQTMASSPLVSMIKGQLATNGIHDPRILHALESVDRSMYVPQHLQSVAYVDDDLKLCKGRWLLEPLVFALMLKHADIQPDHHVLDVGAGLGYSSKVMAHLARQVTATEDSAELVTNARKKLNDTQTKNIELVTAPLTNGCSGHAPYDKIILEGALDTIPDTLTNQLADGGTLVGVLSHNQLDASQKRFGAIVTITKHGERLATLEHERVAAYPLTHSTPYEQFRF